MAALFVLIPLKHSETVIVLISFHLDFGAHIHDLHLRSHLNLSPSSPLQLLSLFLPQQRIRLHHRHSPRLPLLRVPRESHRQCLISLLFRSSATPSKTSLISVASASRWRRRFGTRLPRNWRMTATASSVAKPTRRNHLVFCRAGTFCTRVV